VGLLAPGGILIVSVPVETGLPLLAKQVVRRIAGWRRLGDYAYTSRYTWSECLRSVFAGSRQHMERLVLDKERDGVGSHDHKGFNWRALRAKLARRIPIERTFGSPISALPPDLGSQAFFVARKPASK
jgi:hypothetical protein